MNRYTQPWPCTARLCWNFDSAGPRGPPHEWSREWLGGGDLKWQCHLF